MTPHSRRELNPEGVARFMAELRRRHSLETPEPPPRERPRPTLTAADGSPEPPLPTTTEDYRR